MASQISCTCTTGRQGLPSLFSLQDAWVIAGLFIGGLMLLGGNGLVIMNGEARVPIRGGFGLVTSLLPSDDFLIDQGLHKGSMTLIDDERAVTAVGRIRLVGRIERPEDFSQVVVKRNGERVPFDARKIETARELGELVELTKIQRQKAQ